MRRPTRKPGGKRRKREAEGTQSTRKEGRKEGKMNEIRKFRRQGILKRQNPSEDERKGLMCMRK